MKKNLIFKLCFIVGIFLIILSACDLGTSNKIKRANITFNLEGPAIEQVRANSKASSSSRYIHPDASSLKFELFSGKELLDSQTISIKGDKNISITIQDVPLNDPNLRAEIEVWKNGPTQGVDLLGQNSIHLGRIGLGYTKLTLGVKPAGNFETVKYKKDSTEKIELVESDSGQIFGIQMYPEKGLYTIEAYESGLELYASDGRVYKNTFLIPGGDRTTLVFYHPKDEPSTYYLASSDGENIDTMSGTKLEQKILVTQYDDDDDRDMIVGSEGNIDFGYLSPSGNSSTEIFFTIYNPYPFTLYPNYSSKGESLEDFTFNDFPDAILPGKSQVFSVTFETNKESVYVPIAISANGLEGLFLIFTGTSSGF